MNTFQRWSQTDVTDLRQRLKAGASCAEVAAARGRTLEDVITMMRRLRLRDTVAANVQGKS